MANRTPHCRKCRYALTALASDQCPECGATVDIESGLNITFRPGWIRWKVPCVVSILLVLTLYVGSYIYFASGGMRWASPEDETKELHYFESGMKPRHQFNDGLATTIFRPLHIIHQWISPDDWVEVEVIPVPLMSEDSVNVAPAPIHCKAPDESSD